MMEGYGVLSVSRFLQMYAPVTFHHKRSEPATALIYVAQETLMET